MKRILLVVLVLLGLQTQAQMNLCDSMTATGSQTQLTLQVNNVNTFVDYWCTNSNCGSLLAEDSMSLTHTVYNSQGFDTIVTCITWGMGVTIHLLCYLDMGCKHVVKNGQHSNLIFVVIQ